MSQLYKYIIICLSIASCTGNQEASYYEAENPKSKIDGVHREKLKHLNLNILIDLSDRIDSTKFPLKPSQIERDKAVVNDLVLVFKENISHFGAFKANGKLRIFFRPQLEKQELSNATKGLIFNCVATNNPEETKQNKEIHRNIETLIKDGLGTIYDVAARERFFPGSNIWRFMKEDLNDFCVEKDSIYRNILVILTDGLMFFEGDKIQQGNRFNYIERGFNHFSRFRTGNKLSEEFDNFDYGFIPANSNLHNLEVLVIGIAPSANAPIEMEIIKKYWEKWFFEMGVKRHKLIKTDLPAYQAQLINDFLSYK